MGQTLLPQSETQQREHHALEMFFFNQDGDAG